MSVGDITLWKDRLREERVRRNWRQADLAEQLGTSVVSIQRWEKGRQQPGPYFRIKLNALFGKSGEEQTLVEQPSPLPIFVQGETVSTLPESFSLANGLALWNVPYACNPHFTGRKELLEHLHRQLSIQTKKLQGSRGVALFVNSNWNHFTREAEYVQASWRKA